MSQNPLVDTTTSAAQSSKTPELKPALAAALASLEVKLDQELARYRRTRTVYRTPSQPRVGSPTLLKLQQLTVLSTTEGRKPTVEENSQGKENKFEAASVQQEELSIPDNTNTPSVSTPEIQEEMPVTPKMEEVDNLKMPSTSQSVKTQTTLTSNSTSIVPRVIEEPNNSSTSPEDFLESSEALLRSLAEAQPNTEQPTISSNSLLSPLGIGSMLLLLMASLTFGFIVFNPKSLPQFSLGRLWQRNAPPQVENTEAQGNKTKTGHEPQFTPIPKYPNLAESEFPEVKDPNDVVGLKPKPKSITIASPYPSATPQPTSLATKVPYVQPVTPTITPSISTTVTPNLSSQQPDAEIKPSKDGFYHIVAENQDFQALPSARKVIPDAYLSKDGKFIYLGAVKDKEKAQQLLQKLQEKGFKARIQ